MVIVWVYVPSNSIVIAFLVSNLNESVTFLSFSALNLITSLASAFFNATFSSSIDSTVYLVCSCISAMLFVALSLPNPPTWVILSNIFVFMISFWAESSSFPTNTTGELFFDANTPTAKESIKSLWFLIPSLVMYAFFRFVDL